MAFLVKGIYSGGSLCQEYKMMASTDFKNGCSLCQVYKEVFLCVKGIKR